MKKYRFSDPYQANGKTTFPKSRNRSGVYLIKENGVIVYIGYSASNLYKTLYRHFERWNHRQQQVVTYANKLKRNDYTVRVVYCPPVQAARLEMGLIKKHRPRDNENKYRNYELQLQDKKALNEYEKIEVLKNIPF